MAANAGASYGRRVDQAARLVAFVGSTNLDRSRAFYQSVLGLTLVDHNPGAVVFVRDGTTLRVSKVPAIVAAAYTVLGFVVDDIASDIAALTSRGVQFVRYPQLDQDEHGVWTTPGGEFVAWFNDPDDNLLSLTQRAR